MNRALSNAVLDPGGSEEVDLSAEDSLNSFGDGDEHGVGNGAGFGDGASGDGGGSGNSCQRGKPPELIATEFDLRARVIQTLIKL